MSEVHVLDRTRGAFSPLFFQRLACQVMLVAVNVSAADCHFMWCGVVKCRCVICRERVTKNTVSEMVKQLAPFIW